MDIERKDNITSYTAGVIKVHFEFQVGYIIGCRGVSLKAKWMVSFKENDNIASYTDNVIGTI